MAFDCECAYWAREAANEVTDHHPRCPHFDGQQRLIDHLDFLQRMHGHMTVDLPFGVVVALIAQVQLALRHPGNTGEAATLARNVVQGWINGMDNSSPGIGALLRLGFDPSCDVPTKQDTSGS